MQAMLTKLFGPTKAKTSSLVKPAAATPPPAAQPADDRQLQRRPPSSRRLGAVGESASARETDLSSKSLMPDVKESQMNMKGNATGKPVAQVRPPRRKKKARFVDVRQPSLGSIDGSSPVMEFRPRSGVLS